VLLPLLSPLLPPRLLLLVPRLPLPLPLLLVVWTAGVGAPANDFETAMAASKTASATAKPPAESSWHPWCKSPVTTDLKSTYTVLRLLTSRAYMWF
jgi:hypothetical protein